MIYQICDFCGATIGTQVEGYGAKCGIGNQGFDVCPDCAEKVKAFFVDLSADLPEELTIDSSDKATDALIPKELGPQVYEVDEDEDEDE